MLKALLAAALLSGQAASVPGPTRCISREEVGDLALVGASVVVELVRNACRTYLPTTAFLVSPAGAEFSARLRVEARRRLDSAVDGVARLSGNGTNVPRDAMRTGFEAMMTGSAGAELARHSDASLCRDANEIMEIASTLSPDQMARFVGAFASIADHIARMQPARTPARLLPPPGRPEAAPPAPHPASLEMVPTTAPPPPPVLVPSMPGTQAARRPPRPPFRPFLCQPPE